MNSISTIGRQVWNRDVIKKKICSYKQYQSLFFCIQVCQKHLSIFETKQNNTTKQVASITTSKSNFVVFRNIKYYANLFSEFSKWKLEKNWENSNAVSFADRFLVHYGLVAFTFECISKHECSELLICILVLIWKVSGVWAGYVYIFLLR